MKIDKIGRYRMRGGGTAFIYRFDDDEYYPWEGFCLYDPHESRWWQKDGRYLNYRESPHDLIEYIGPLDGSPNESEVIQALRNELALYREFADDVANLAAQDSDMWRPIGWLLFNLKANE